VDDVPVQRGRVAVITYVEDFDWQWAPLLYSGDGDHGEGFRQVAYNPAGAIPFGLGRASWSARMAKRPKGNSYRRCRQHKCQQREEVLEVPVGSVLQMLVKEPLGIPRVAAVE
jgi:hypothetical protein